MTTTAEATKATELRTSLDELDPAAVAKRVRDLRTEKRMTIEELAAAVGISERTLQRYENDETPLVNFVTISRLARALGTTPYHLLGTELVDLDEPLDVPTRHAVIVKYLSRAYVNEHEVTEAQQRLAKALDHEARFGTLGTALQLVLKQRAHGKPESFDARADVVDQLWNLGVRVTKANVAAWLDDVELPNALHITALKRVFPGKPYRLDEALERELDKLHVAHEGERQHRRRLDDVRKAGLLAEIVARLAPAFAPKRGKPAVVFTQEVFPWRGNPWGGMILRRDPALGPDRVRWELSPAEGRLDFFDALPRSSGIFTSLDEFCALHAELDELDARDRGVWEEPAEPETAAATELDG